MKNSLLSRVKKTFFSEALEFRAKLFNVLAITGFLISALTALTGTAISIAPGNVIANGAAAVLALVLLICANRSGRYRLCYFITIFAVFIVLFPYMFFSAGAYHSGMPSFFVFAVVFTIFMLEGRAAAGMALLELSLYAGLCFYARRNPGAVSFFGNEDDLLVDVIFGFTSVSAGLGAAMFFQLRLYNKRRRELEAAREEALRLSRVKTNFLANMSHEIRTPINVILGMNEMILREGGNEETARYSRAIESAGRILLAQINNALDMTRIESGRMELNEEPWKTGDLIRELYGMEAETARRKGLAFTVEADADLPSELFGDYTRIKQVALNFLSNAFKYTERGGVTLRAGGGMEKNAFVLRIAVEDTGMGIREEDRGELFKVFSRLDPPERGNIEGTGLGLAIAKELTELLGGTVAVESVWGKGSVFTARFPQAIRNRRPLGAVDYRRPPSPAAGEERLRAPNARVLAVDDNPENLAALTALLKRTELRVDTASNGAECIALAKERSYHAILLDYRMPGMDGEETLSRLRAEIPGFAVPVIAFTAQAAAGQEQRFLDRGFAAYLPKPALWQDLERTLARLLPGDLVEKRRIPEQGESETGIGSSALREALAGQGISLDRGLEYFSASPGEYRKTAGMFLASYPPRLAEMRRLVEEGRWAALKYPVHSLKSGAKTLGALTLGETAARLEQYCLKEKAALIPPAFELLAAEWAEAAGGLALFIAETGAEAKNAETEAGVPAPDKEALPADLLASIRNMNLIRAKKELQTLLDTADEGERPVFTALQEKLKTLEYGQAENLLVEYMKGDRNNG